MNKGIWVGGLKTAGRFLLASVMCMIVSMSLLTMLDGFLGRFLGQVINLIIVISLSYVPMWNEANNDVNKINYERMRRDDFLGLKYGIIAAIPGIAVYLMLLLSVFGITGEGYFSLYRFLNPIFLPLNISIMSPNLTMNEIGILPVLYAGFEMLLPIVICGFAYALGLRRYSLSERFIYPYAPEKKRKKKLRRY